MRAQATTYKQANQSLASANRQAGAGLVGRGQTLTAVPKTVPSGVLLIFLGMLAMEQARRHIMAAAQGKKVVLSIAARSTPDIKSAPPRANDVAASLAADPVFDQGQTELNRLGYAYTSAGLRNPDGSLTPASAMQTPETMAAAGLSPSVIFQVQKELNAFQSSIPTVALRGPSRHVPSANPAGPKLRTPSSEGSSLPSPRDAERFPGFNASTETESLAREWDNEPSARLRGEPILVSGTDIFEFMHYAYQKRRKDRRFYEADALSP